MILDKITANTRIELEDRKKSVSFEQIKELAGSKPRPKDMAAALRGDDIRIIAEVKKASPSKGVICHDFDPINIARTYAENGAAAISVLTDSKFFQGSLEYLKNIHEALGETRPPLLRKDFIIEPYQVYEALYYGADAILLIAAILKQEELDSLLNLSHQIGLKCLVETHNEIEVEKALKSGAEIIGINNRDLQTFNVDLETTARLRGLVPPDRIVVSESGIKTGDDIKLLKSWKVNAVLIGETLVASGDTGAKLRELR